MNSVARRVGTFGTNLADGTVTSENAQEMVDLLDGQLNGGGL
jgi:hypothetical protein